MPVLLKSNGRRRARTDNRDVRATTGGITALIRRGPGAKGLRSIPARSGPGWDLSYGYRDAELWGHCGLTVGLALVGRGGGL
jgi:hypothetical protein